MAPPAEVMTSSDEEAQERQTAQPKRLSPALLLAGTAGFAAVVLLACHASGSISRAVPRREPQQQQQPLTVRALLEGDDMAADMARNIMAFTGETDYAKVHERVAAGLGKIRDEIRERSPEAHEKMGHLLLTQEQREGATRVLQKLSDSRMLALTQKVTTAVRETAQEKGDQSV
eukprot:CAMPEP_0183444180 /NCGR_PEP_ID=MMETSP0370-20130417/94248_1 /TAXON_ID=268820 /ORGANISM="Peridinium aciculiferum, Strain PAER-2" /LENGTH=173 /DNA_ID=CAMNT_0025634461 /DNA_START=27 /DNA_END=544 /DNA_ORIENTATION=-